MKSSGFILADHANHGRVFIVLFHPVDISVTIDGWATGQTSSAIDGCHHRRRKLMDGRCRMITAVVMVTIQVVIIVVVVVVGIIRANDD